MASCTSLTQRFTTSLLPWLNRWTEDTSAALAVDGSLSTMACLMNRSMACTIVLYIHGGVPKK